MSAISELRKSKGLSIAEVALRLNKTTGYVSHLETGRRTFSPELLSGYAQAIGESEDLVYEKVSQMKDRVIDVRSWVALIRINNQPVLKAFEKFLEVEIRMRGNKDINKSNLRYKFAEYIEKNIAQAILDEFDHDETLEELIKERYKHLI